MRIKIDSDSSFHLQKRVNRVMFGVRGHTTYGFGAASGFLSDFCSPLRSAALSSLENSLKSTITHRIVKALNPLEKRMVAEIGAKLIRLYTRSTRKDS